MWLLKKLLYFECLMSQQILIGSVVFQNSVIVDNVDDHYSVI